MKRVPLVVSFLLFIALCASVAYWAMQLFKPPLRPVAAPPRVAQAEIRTDAAASLFGGRVENVAVASNYQLKGVIFAGNSRNSVAILSADGKPAQAVRVDMEVAPGVTVQEVHSEYVLLSEGGTTKRVELPEGAKGQVDLASLAPVPVQPSTVPAPSSPPPTPTRAQAAAGGAPSVNMSAPPTAPLPMPPSVVAQPSVQGASAAPSYSPIPPGTVPSVQPAPTAPPTVVVSPPPSVPQSAVPGSNAAPSVPARTAPSSAAAAPVIQPQPAAGGQNYPVRPASPETAPLISR